MLKEIPVRLCCGQRHWGAVCPDGKIMCQLCYNRFWPNELHIDENGQVWDICANCKAEEDTHA